jgi:hypothetical protein
LGANPEGIGSRVAGSRPVCVGTISRGDFNNCSRTPEHACVTFTQAADGRMILVVLGACDRHVLRAKYWLAENVSCIGEVLVTTPEGLEATLTDEEKASVHHLVPKAASA